ncbi:pilin [Candidatus Saccharibacteria bacterium]|nr:pilin [Candidatus Saccharibacteria bacterium]
MFDRFAVGMSNWTVPGTGVNAANLNDPGDVAGLIMNVLVWLVAALAVAFIVIGGIKYVTSGGDEKKVASAKNTILYAVIGLVVALLANVIIRIVLGAIGVNTAGF